MGARRRGVCRGLQAFGGDGGGCKGGAWGWDGAGEWGPGVVGSVRARLVVAILTVRPYGLGGIWGGCACDVGELGS